MKLINMINEAALFDKTIELKNFYSASIWQDEARIQGYYKKKVHLSLKQLGFEYRKEQSQPNIFVFKKDKIVIILTKKSSKKSTTEISEPKL